MKYMFFSVLCFPKGKAPCVGSPKLDVIKHLCLCLCLCLCLSLLLRLYICLRLCVLDSPKVEVIKHKSPF